LTLEAIFIFVSCNRVSVCLTDGEEREGDVERDHVAQDAVYTPQGVAFERERERVPDLMSNKDIMVKQIL